MDELNGKRLEPWVWSSGEMFRSRTPRRRPGRRGDSKSREGREGGRSVWSQRDGVKKEAEVS